MQVSSEIFKDLNDARIYAENIVETIREPLVILNSDLRVVSANNSFYEHYQVSKEKTEGELIYDLGNHQWDIPELREFLEDVIPHNSQYNDYEVEHDFPNIGHRIMLLNGRKITQEEGGRSLILLAIEDITDKATIERKLKESEEKFKGFIQTINSIIFKFNKEGRITFFNRFAEKIFGYTEQEVLGKPLAGTILSEQNTDGKDLCGLTGDILEFPERYYLREIEGRRKDGGTVWFQFSAVAIKDEKGDVQEILVDGNDSTGIKEYSRMLQETKSLVESSPDIIVRFKDNMELAYANPLLMQFLKKPVDQIIGRTIREIGLPDTTASDLEQAMRKARDTHNIEIIHSRIADREYKVQVIPETNGEKEITSLKLYANDVTDLKNLENTLRRNEYELRTLVDNSPDLIFRLDQQLKYAYANPAYERLTGIAKEKMIGKTNSDLRMPSPLAEFWLSAVSDVLGSGREHSVEFEMTSLFGERYFSARLIPEFAKSGLVETVLIIARDITERKLAEDQIRFISFHDEVTGLFNRAFFEEEIRRINTERELPISIIMGDINYLKLSNDVFGHQEGDRLLKTIADAIKKACRKNDIVARWGGDEFAAILPKTDFTTASEVCYRIKQIAKESEGTVIHPSIALGVGTKRHKDQHIYQVIRNAEERMYDDKMSESKHNEKELISAFIEQACARKHDLATHIDQSHELGRRFGKELGLEEDQLKSLLLLIEMHDIGAAVIPRDVLTKPERLSQEEWSLVKKHPEAGFRIVKTFPDTAKISDEVLSHAEHWDGSGYPRGVMGKEIPYLSRIFALIDAYDVMTHERPYARVLTHEEAIEEIQRNSGKQFDPEMAEKFVKAMAGQSQGQGTRATQSA